MKVLVIDDSEATRKSLEDFLQSLGHEVVLAANGPEGIEKCNGSVHLVITDRQMPEMLGEEVIREIKKCYPKIKVVLMTGDDLNEAVKHAIMAAGAEEILSKPFELDKIKEVLQRLSEQSNRKEVSERFYGRWDTVVDKKWRLNIPAAISSQIDNLVLLREGEDKCIWIERLPLKADKMTDPSSIFIIEMKKRKDGLKRIPIPRALRGSTSFYYGKNVTIAGKGDHLEIWPRP